MEIIVKLPEQELKQILSKITVKKTQMSVKDIIHDAEKSCYMLVLDESKPTADVTSV
jgi:hypothetical protein